ncbi:FmdB family zinc ribbon protein [Streptomyces smyrnaeus]|uniref:FmdB family transcriptional regulator n=1 Tax=Streptomyces smyrnaeus TaxID=1387713 RepID=A0ABS3XWB9_9ACTN|nr:MULTISPECIES: FmdB family zinc ribbon protein [Streptomyces]MBO8199693.1 FmdB family transcriptional regulator [Streptomyces smyrnaeus]MBQ0866632.1 FmdB family transcriptional regulator [Streptomyces sp. RK75]MBQ1119052.1 FmdB family transcriptional regulator [Streptomyces sp. B15]MBQ1160146.1 FmdB family transcriptional regulator [Streptomyces sp. A73]
MPTYQYQCTECGEGLEVVQKFTDDSLTECPGCQGHLKKVYSAVGIVFKGSGFYRNDSRSSSSSSSSPASSSSSSDSSGKNGDSKGSSSSSDSSSSSSSSSESKSSGKSDSKSTAKAGTSA